MKHNDHGKSHEIEVEFGVKFPFRQIFSIDWRTTWIVIKLRETRSTASSLGGIDMNSIALRRSGSVKGVSILVSIVIIAIISGVILDAVEKQRAWNAKIRDMADRHLPGGMARVIVLRDETSAAMDVIVNGEKVGTCEPRQNKEFMFKPRPDGANTLEFKIHFFLVTAGSGKVELLAMPGHIAVAETSYTDFQLGYWIKVDLKNADGYTYSPGAGVIKATYMPPGIPISFSIDTNGNLSVQGEASFVTPIGTFSLGGDYTLNPEPDYIHVVIRDRRKGRSGTDTIYRVRVGDQELSFVFVGKTQIRIKDKRVTIDVSDGVAQIVSFGQS